MSRAVLFDVDGVLVHGYHARPEKQVRWDDRLKADLGVNPDEFREKFIKGVFVEKVIVGQMPLLEALDRALPGFGYRGSSSAFVEYWLTHDSNLNQPLFDVVGRLKASGARLFIATNQEHLRAKWLWENLKLSELFEDIFHSAKVGAIKPTKPYFDWVSNRLGPQTDRPLFFDDREDVIAAANSYGWEGVLFNDLSDASEHPWIAPRLDTSIVTSR